MIEFVLIEERSNLVIEAKEVKTVKEVIRSDGLWRLACGNVYDEQKLGIRVLQWS